MLYAVLAVSSIARGRVTFLDVAAAKAHPSKIRKIRPTSSAPGLRRARTSGDAPRAILQE
jgi:hypothetical protein